MFGGQFGVSQMVWKTACAALWWICSSKRAQANRRKVSIQAVLRRMRVLDGFLVKNRKELRSLFKNSRFRKAKPIAVTEQNKHSQADLIWPVVTL
jgi:hypothetical protein